MHPRLLLLSMMLTSPVMAAPAALHLIHAGDVTPSTVPLLAQDPGAQPISFHLSAPALPSPLSPTLDEGGGAGVRSDLAPVLAILLSALVGFGTGHLVAGDQQGFILFLLVDLVILAVDIVLLNLTPLWGLANIAFLISHIVQVLDVYPKVMGGSRLVERARQRSIALASAFGPDPALPATTRVFGLAF